MATLETLLIAEVETAQTLLDTLKEEYEALQQTRPEQLEEIVKKKLQLLTELTRLSSERQRFLTDVHCANDATAIEAYAQQQGKNTLVLWYRLCGLAQTLQTQNITNGGMIRLSQQRTQLALDILTQRDPDNKTYGKRGYTEQGSSPHTSVRV